MESAESLLEGKLVAAYKAFVLLIPNIVVGIILFGLFIGAAWVADRAVTKAFHSRSQFDLGSLLGGFTRWALKIGRAHV